MLRKRGFAVLVFVLMVLCMALTAALFLREAAPPSGRRMQAADGVYFVEQGSTPVALTGLTGDKRLFSNLRTGE